MVIVDGTKSRVVLGGVTADNMMRMFNDQVLGFRPDCAHRGPHLGDPGQKELRNQNASRKSSSGNSGSTSGGNSTSSGNSGSGYGNWDPYSGGYRYDPYGGGYRSGFGGGYRGGRP